MIQNIFKKTLQNSAGFALATIVFAGVIALPVPMAAAFSINDVNVDSLQYDAIADLVTMEAMTLDARSNFRPNEPMNKAAFLKAAFVYSGYRHTPQLNYATGFADVPADSWFAPYVRRAVEAGFVRAVGDNLFRPSDYLNRQEALLWALQVYGVPTPYVLPEQADLFADIRANRFLSHIYSAAKKYNIYFAGDADYFRPARTLTRADAAELLFRSRIAGAAILGQNVSVIIDAPRQPVSRQPDIDSRDLTSHPTFAVFNDTWNQINNYYLDKGQISRRDLLYGAINGMVNSLGDPYSSFITPEQVRDSVLYLPADYEGIGAVIDFLNDQYIVQTTLNNSPAQRAGLRTGDVIIEIDSKPLFNLGQDEVLGLLQGAAGTRVQMVIKRGNDFLTFNITRERIDFRSVHGEILNNDILYIRIDQFTEISDIEFSDLLDELEYQKYSKMILDVRNNPGGYLSSTQEIMNFFLSENQVEFLTEDANGRIDEYLSAGPGNLKDYQKIVLINNGSASAAEILAGALQDYGYARLLGEGTFGKGTVQELIEYQDSSLLKLTVGRWLTPNKNDIDRVGVQPDIEVKADLVKMRDGEDNQLQRAISELR